MKRTLVAAVLILAAGASTALASGLAIPEQGAAAMGMAAAMTARSEDLSAIFYNPAGIDYVENNEVFIGLTPIMPAHTYTHTGGKSVDAKSQVFLPPQIYAARRMAPNVVLGMGVYAPFGLGTDWKKDWNGRYTSTYGEIQSIYFNPTIAVQLNEMVSVGLGVSYVYSSANIEKMVDAGLPLYSATGGNAAFVPLIGNAAYDSEFRLDGTGSGFGFNLGAIIRATEGLQLGISYRGATDIDYEGTAKFIHNKSLSAISLGSMTALDAITAKMPASQDGKATLHLPWMLGLGAKYDITDAWDASVDFDYVGWSVYDELVIDFATDLPMPKQTQEKDWENSFVFRLGSSYDVNESLTARAGVLYDQTPVPDYTFDGQLPDNDRVGISFGGGYKLGMVRIDASYMFLSFADRDKDNFVGYADTNADGSVNTADQAALNALSGGAYSVGTGKYESSAHLFSVSMSYCF